MNQIQPTTVQRDERGYWVHPDLPDFNQSPDLGEIEAWCQHQGITTTRMIKLLEKPGLPQYLADQAITSGNISGLPLPDLAEHWFLLAIFDYEGHPAAWYATRQPANSLGQIAPPRPEISTAMVTLAVSQVVGRLLEHGHLDQGAVAAVQAQLIEEYVDGMETHELYDLVYPLGYGWPDSAAAEAKAILGDLPSLLWQQQQSAERDWVARHAIAPRLPLSSQVRFTSAGKTLTGTLVGNDFEHGRHLIQTPGKAYQHRVPYELVEAE